MQKKEIVFFSIIFILIQIIGLITANYYIQLGMNTGFFTKDPNSLLNVVFIISGILILTFTIIILKYLFKRSGFLYVFEYPALFAGTSIVFSVFLPGLVPYLFALYLLLVKTVYYNHKKISLWLNNFLLGLAIAGAGTMLGISLGLIPIIFLIVSLAIYDIIAVFYTKHMVALAKIISEKNFAFLFVIPTKEKEFKLGGGDVAIPMMVSASLFNILILKWSLTYTILPIIGIWGASIVGLLLTFYILDKTKMHALPALPIQVLLMVIIIIITYFTMII